MTGGRSPDAVRAGVDARILRTSLYRRIFRGVWIRRDAWTKDTSIDAALALHPEDAVASHHSAARLFRLPVPEHPFEHVTVFDPGDRRFRREIKSHVTLRPMPVATWRGRRVTHPLRTFIDLAGWISLVDLVTLGDAMLTLLKLRRRDLVDYCAASSAYYAGLASNAAAYVREGVDSPMESRVRLLIVLSGLPEPVVNHRLLDACGRVRRRLDLSYPHLKLIIEYDGRHHIELVDQWASDLERREEFDDGDWKILVITAEGVYKHPMRTLERIRRNLILRGYGSVPPLNPVWKQHFSA